jgi:hypothetical protein
VGECVVWWDKEHEEYVRKVLEQQPPGAYLMSVASAKEAMDKYFKMEKNRWQSMFMHDYFLALLRKDEDMKSLLREAYGKLAEAFDWPEKEPWTRIEENPLDFASDAADALFDFYAEKLRVEGWRSRVDEAVKEAKDRLLKEPSPIGDKYRTEYGRWIALKRILHDELEQELRLKDRVAYWETMEIETLARSILRTPTARLPTYMEGILREMLDGTGIDHGWDMSMWYLHKAFVEFEEHLDIKGYGSFDNEELLVMAIMAADGVEPTEDEKKQVNYLKEVATRLNMPELVSLYYTSKFGPVPRKFFSGAFKDWEEMTDDEKKFFEEQRKACQGFMNATMTAIYTLLSRKGEILIETIR